MAAGLHNHALNGSMAGKRAISVDDDIRIVFIEHGDYAEVTLLDEGSHREVYRG
jgi:mRNA-degrading endonuclease YafQ of YafQ-DinJ toxin-antitoxin module